MKSRISNNSFKIWKSNSANQFISKNHKIQAPILKSIFENQKLGSRAERKVKIRDSNDFLHNKSH